MGPVARDEEARPARGLTRLRERLRESGATAAGPYGYTLTIWGAGMLGINVLGSPSPIEVFAFVVGAVFGFVAVETAAWGDPRPRSARPPSAVMAIWGNAHVPAAAGSILLAWLVDSVIDADVAWIAAGFAATAAYLVLSAVESLAAERFAVRHTAASE